MLVHADGHLTPCSSYVEEGDDHAKDEQHVGHGRALPGLEVLEGERVSPSRHELRAVVRASVGQHYHQVECLHGIDDPQHDDYERDRAQQRHRHVAEPLPGAATVERRRFPELVRDVLEARVQQDGVEGDPDPYVDKDDHEHRLERRVEPEYRAADQVERAESLVDDAALPGEHYRKRSSRSRWAGTATG